MRWLPRFLNVRQARTILETLLLGTVLWFSLLILQSPPSSSIVRLGVMSLLVGPICMLLYALRLQLPKGSWWRQAIFEVAIAGVLSLVLSGMELAFIFVLLRHPASSTFRRDSYRPYELAALALAANCATFVIFRTGRRLWLFWDRLRRTQLQWALTHAHVMVLALGAGLLIVLVESLVISHSRDFFLVVPTTVGLIVLSVIALAAVVPPSALFSYLVVRRITDRLKTLAAATSTLRGGNYAVRVPVVGEDEVAQLQADFNAMAADLERTMHELQGERDRVAGLLQARRELIANVSHELRTPMATLRGYLETTLTHWDDRSQPTLHHDLQVMENEVIHLQGLVEDLFALSRAEVGKLTLRCEPTDVGILVQRIVETAAPLVWQASRIEVVAEVACGLPSVLVDGNRLEQVLQNLLHNAVRHTSPGGIVAVVVVVEPEVVVLQVKDTGEGIAPGDLPHVWERFYQTESARIGSGTGLGLALVKEWVEAMGGIVSAESVLGEGSCFSISLMISCCATSNQS